MMNSMQIPTPATNAEFGTVATLLALLADPAARKARLDELVAATDKYNAVLTDARAALVQLETDTAAASEAIQAERQAAAADIDQRRTQMGVDAAAIRERSKDNDRRAGELDRVQAALNAREVEITRREAAFRDAAEAVARVRA